MTRFVLVALVVGACTGGGLQSTVARVRVPEAVELPKTYVGETTRIPLQIEAIGQAPVQIHSVDSRSSDLSMDRSAAIITGGTSVTLTLAWAPAAAGELRTELVIATDVEGAEELRVPIHGVSAVIPDCDDRNACTDDTFDRAAESCRHAPHERACDDGNACTADDRCRDGACLGVARTCDDHDTCTRDLCDPTQGCLFLPDARQCDDHDPCTRDVCDREKGCAHPAADDGTRCGEFSCDIAHLCVLGTCRELDVTSTSDGFPCSDGDACTEGDACLAGACVGGAHVASGPQVVASIETFGGDGDGLASDGFRYVFTDSLRTRVATTDAAGRLVVRGRVDVGSTIAPVMLAPGRFLVGAGSTVSLVDATSAAQPELLWTWNIPAMAAGEPRFVRQVAPVTGGFLLLCRLTNDRGRDQVLFVPLPDATQVPWLFVQLHDEWRIWELDADGPFVAVLGPRPLWYELGADGVPRNTVVLETTSGRIDHVRVLRQRVALTVGAMLEVRDVVVADADSPSGTRLAWSEVLPDVPSGLAYTDDGVFVGLPSGIRVLVPDPQGSAFASSTLDPLENVGLSRAPGHLLATGPVALPLALRSAAPGGFPTLTRLTGPGHGGVKAIVEGPADSVLVAGRVAMGSVDLHSHNISRWSISDHAASPDAPRVLVGPTSADLVDTYATTDPARTDACYGTPLTIVDETLAMRTEPICGLEDAVLTTSGRTLVAETYTTSIYGTPRPSRRLASWNLAPFEPQPAWAPYDEWTRAKELRATSDGRLIRIDSPPDLDDVVHVLAGPPSYASEFEVGIAFSFQPGRVAVDGSALFSPAEGAIWLDRMEGRVPVPVGSSMQAGTAAYWVPSASRGRAWTATTGERTTLVELTYPPDVSFLDGGFVLNLDDELVGLRDTGPLTIAATKHAILLIRPDCR